MDEITVVRRSKTGRWPLWLIVVITGLALFNVIPFLAPLFMKLGWEKGGQAIYLIYGSMCHQMAQRSFFLFGPKGFQMVNIADLPVDIYGMSTTQAMLVLRRFTGNETLGWKVAWSDRMVYMYLAPLLVAVVYGFIRQRGPVKPLQLWVFLALLLPMAVDGGTHWVSDLSGLTGGFRYQNTWLADLTHHALPASFYIGDAFGSFNSWMRLISGVAFGVAIGGLLYPYVDMAGDLPADQAPLQETGVDGVMTASGLNE